MILRLIHFCRRSVRCEESKKPHGCLKAPVSVQPGWSLKDTWTRTCCRNVLKRRKKKIKKSHNRRSRFHSSRMQPNDCTEVQKLRCKYYTRKDDPFSVWTDSSSCSQIWTSSAPGGNAMYLRDCHQGTACDKRFLMSPNGQKDLLLHSSPASRRQHKP